MREKLRQAGNPSGGAAQKVEHYDMAWYITAGNLAQQLKTTGLVQLLPLSLAERRTPASSYTSWRGA
jgi:ferritin-like metal-binding protein YciE